MPSWSECLQPPRFLQNSWSSNRKSNGAEENRLFESLDDESTSNFRQPRSLIELCSETVVADSGLCEDVLNSGITPSIFNYLFTAAVAKSKDLSIQTLISHWPHTSLSLAEHGGRSEMEMDRQLTRWLTGEMASVDEVEAIASLSVTQSFINSLRKRAPSRLRVLDLRGYPCVDYGIEYLTGHSMLAYNESQRAGIIRLVQDMANSQRITSEQASAFGDLSDANTTIPEHAYAVIVDCVLESEGRALVELCKALKITPYNHAHLKLVVNQLHLCQLGEDYIDLFLPLLDAHHLIGLNVSFNSLGTDGLRRTLESLTETRKFDSLQRLDLGSNNIDFHANEAACRQFATAFHRLTQLRRLDLRGNRLSRRLRSLFTPPFDGVTNRRDRHNDESSLLERRLEYLNLSGCRLVESDFIFLSNTPLLDHLRQLDLSDNDFASSTSSLCCILKRVRATLVSLRLERCGLRDQQAERVLGAHLNQMDALRALSVSDNVWTSRVYYEELPQMVKGCSALRGLRVGYAIECYQEDEQQQLDGGHNNDPDELVLARQIRKTQFYCALNRAIENEVRAPRSSVRLVCIELDQALL